MPDLKIFYNPRCSKCREALRELEPRGPEIHDYLERPPTEAELLSLMDILEGDVRELVRTKEAGFRERPFTLDDRRVIARELSLRPELLERPIVVYRGHAVIARPVERLRVLF